MAIPCIPGATFKLRGEKPSLILFDDKEAGMETGVKVEGSDLLDVQRKINTKSWHWISIDLAKDFSNFGRDERPADQFTIRFNGVNEQYTRTVSAKELVALIEQHARFQVNLATAFDEQRDRKLAASRAQEAADVERDIKVMQARLRNLKGGDPSGKAQKAKRKKA